jgi:putative DNA methylase
MGGGTTVSAYKRKLIEVALPLEDINRESVRQKTKPRVGMPTTLHKYWAQRSVATARAAVWASLVDDPSSHPEMFPTVEAQDKERARLFSMLKRLVLWETTSEKALWREAAEIARKDCGGVLPPFLDPFAGSGAIPLEALRLGLPARASDLNPLAVTLERALIEWPQRFIGLQPVHPRNRHKIGNSDSHSALADDIREYARDAAALLENKIGKFYPAAKDGDGNPNRPGVYMWARTVACPNPACKAATPLVKNWELSRSKKSASYIKPVVNLANRTVRFKIEQGDELPKPSFTGRHGGECLFCKTPIPLDWVRKKGVEGSIGSVLMAIACGEDRSWSFLEVDDEQQKAVDSLPEPNWAPRGELPNNSRDFSTQLYGLTTWASLFTKRQLVSLTTLVDLTREFEEKISLDAQEVGMPGSDEGLSAGGNGARAYAQLVRTYMHLATTYLTMWCNGIVGWSPRDPSLGALFSRQSIKMNWNYAEGSLIGKGSANFLQKIERVARAVENAPLTLGGSAGQADATRLSWLSGTRPLVVTDPPYYDNISYSELADFFYVWLREAMRDIDPETFATISCPKAEELIMARDRHSGDEDVAKQFFEDGLTQALSHLRTISDPQLPISIYYAYNDTDESEDEAGNTQVGSSGWETILQSIVDAGLQINMTYPLRSESAGRAVAQHANALAACILLVCRPRPDNAKVGTRGDFTAGLKTELSVAIRHLKQGELGALDLSQAAIGPGMSIFTRYSKVLEADGTTMSMRTALDLINKAVSDVAGTSDANFDSVTRWCIRWYGMHGYSAAPYGDAQALANANGVVLADLERAGVLSAKGGQVALLAGDSLAANWNPQTDERITTWEVLHYLLAALLPKNHGAASRAAGGSEDEAHALAKMMSPALLDQSKELAYRLFDLARQQNLDKEALAFNAIGQAWADLKGTKEDDAAQLGFSLEAN